MVKKCVASDLNGETILYFGPSNKVGPGTVWRAGSDGGYRLRWSLQEMPGNEVFMNPGNQSSCEGSSTTKFGFKAALGLTSQITPASGSLANDFQKAKSINVKAASVAWNTIKEGPFENYIKALPATAGIREDLGKGNRLVLYRALRVSGYSAVMEFNTSDVAELKAKYPGPLPKSVTGELSAGL